MRVIKLNPKYYLTGLYVNTVVVNYIHNGVLHTNYDFIFKLKYGYISKENENLQLITKYLICG